MLEFLRNLLELEGIPSYEEIVDRQFSEYIATHPFTGSQGGFCGGAKCVFAETADIYEPPLDSFGTEAVERWFSEGEVSVLLEFKK